MRAEVKRREPAVTAPESYDPEVCPWCSADVETPKTCTKPATCPHCGGTFVLSYHWNVNDGEGGEEYEMLEGREPPTIKGAPCAPK